MSDGHEHDAHDGAADAHHEAFDGEPARELGPDEPMTPGWMPALGAALFVGLALFALAESGGPASTTGAAPSATAAAQTAAQPAQPAQNAPPTPSFGRPRRLDQPEIAPPPGGQPAPGSPAIKRLTPDEIRDVTRKLQEKKQQQEGAPK